MGHRNNWRCARAVRALCENAPKNTFGLLGVHKQVERANFEPIFSNVVPSQGRMGLENGLLWDHKWPKNGSKQWFSKNDPSPIVVPKQMNTGHFAPLLSRCLHSALSIVYLICRRSLLDDVPSPTSPVPIFNPGLGFGLPAANVHKL